ncbi:MAG TPA: response regulator [Flavobacteriales bacterium]
MRPIEILLVEDNPGDVRLTREALIESRIENNLSVVTDGAAAIDFLEQRGEYVGVALPDLVLLDLNLPKISGHDVLRRIKNSDLLKRIPVVALTTSYAQADIDACYDEHVNCYIAKPMSYGPFMDVMRSVEEFWLNCVQLPYRPHQPWNAEP